MGITSVIHTQKGQLGAYCFSKKYLNENHYSRQLLLKLFLPTIRVFYCLVKRLPLCNSNYQRNNHILPVFELPHETTSRNNLF